MSRPTYMTIDLSALVHNLGRVRAYAANRAIIAMVKANAYGHGIVPIAKALTHADAFGVASLEEGLSLRAGGILAPILLMEGLFHKDELEEAGYQSFQLIIHHPAHIEILEKAPPKYQFTVWLKINTGMNRLGIAPEDLEPFYHRLSACPAVKKPIGLMTHLATADIPANADTKAQIERFVTLTKRMKGPRSIANSAAILAWPETHADVVRPGLMLFGASPFPEHTGDTFDLKPVMTLSSRVIAITQVKKGSKVGYGGTWVAPEDRRIGVVGVGYGDGYPQFAKNGTPVIVKNKRCQLVGRVSMDMLTVDLHACPEAEVGDRVILWGKGLPVEMIAKYSNTSAYEILTRMTPRPKVDMIGIEARGTLLNAEMSQSD